MDVLSAANARQRLHGDVISLAAGQPSAGAPAPVLAAAGEALGGRLGYTEQLGIPELRAAIAGHYARSYALDVSPAEVWPPPARLAVSCSPSSPRSTSGTGSRSPAPATPPTATSSPRSACEVVELACGPATRFQLTVQMLAEAGRQNGLVLASPANPTSTMLDASDLATVAGWCAERGVQLVSDEIYHGISYGTARPASAWQFSREAVVVNSFSKYSP